MRQSIRTVLAVLLLLGASAGVAPTAVAKKGPVEVDPSSYEDAPYQKLGSESFAKDFHKKPIHFKATFLGEWTITGPYGQIGVKTKDQVFVNHRAEDYTSSANALGSSDMEFPTFAVSLPKDRSDIVYELKKGDVIEVWGTAVKTGGIGKKASIWIEADKIAKAAQ